MSRAELSKMSEQALVMLALQNLGIEKCLPEFKSPSATTLETTQPDRLYTTADVADACWKEVQSKGLMEQFVDNLLSSVEVTNDVDSQSFFEVVKAARNHREVIMAALLAVEGESR